MYQGLKKQNNLKHKNLNKDLLTKAEAVEVYVASCTFTHRAFVDSAPAPVPSKFINGPRNVQTAALLVVYGRVICSHD